MKYVKDKLTCWPTSRDEQTSARMSYFSWENKAVSRAMIDEVRDQIARPITPVSPVTHEVAMHIHWSISRIHKRLKPRGIRVKPFSSKEVVNDP